MDDAISRNAIADILRGKSIDTEEDVRYVAVEIHKWLRTLDVAPVVHARWILKHIGAGHYWECSACYTNPCIYVTENTKYCPNCGAKMDGEEK